VIWDPWSSVSEGRAAPGSPVSAAAIDLEPQPNRRIALFVADPNGGIYTTSGNAQVGWAPWTSVSEGRTAPGSLVTVVTPFRVAPRPDRFHLFVADPNGGIYTTSGNAEDGWAPWTSVSEGRTAPGSPVTAVASTRHLGRFALFVADPNGGIYTTSGNAEDGWAPWTSVSEGRTAPGSPVTAERIGTADPNNPGRFALFVADPNGGIYTTSGKPEDGWNPWSSVSEFRAAPGSPITAVTSVLSLTRSSFDLFVTDPNGGIYTTSGNAEDGWAPWTSVSEGSAAPGSPVTAISSLLFITDPNGGISMTSQHASGWDPWTSVSEGRAAPGSPVTGIYRPFRQPLPLPPTLHLFVTDPNGGIYTTSWRLRKPTGPTSLRVTNSTLSLRRWV